MFSLYTTVHTCPVCYVQHHIAHRFESFCMSNKMEGHIINFEWFDINKLPALPPSPPANKCDSMDPLAFPSIKTEPIINLEDCYFQGTIKREVEDRGNNDFLINFTDFPKKHRLTDTKDESRPNVGVLSTDIEVHKCRKCNAKLSSRVELLRHERKEHFKKHTCSSCNKSWSSILMLNDHLNRHHKNVKNVNVNLIVNSNKSSDKNIIYNCKLCRESFYKLSKLNNHAQSHNKPKFVCSVCKKSWPRKYLFDAHVVKEHSNIKVPVIVEYGDNNITNKLPESSMKEMDMSHYISKYKLKSCTVKVGQYNINKKLPKSSMKEIDMSHYIRKYKLKSCTVKVEQLKISL